MRGISGVLVLNYVFLEFSENTSTLSSCKMEVKICFPPRVITSIKNWNPYYNRNMQNALEHREHTLWRRCPSSRSGLQRKKWWDCVSSSISSGYIKEKSNLCCALHDALNASWEYLWKEGDKGKICFDHWGISTLKMHGGVHSGVYSAVWKPQLQPSFTHEETWEHCKLGEKIYCWILPKKYMQLGKKAKSRKIKINWFWEEFHLWKTMWKYGHKSDWQSSSNFIYLSKQGIPLSSVILWFMYWL